MPRVRFVLSRSVLFSLILFPTYLFSAPDLVINEVMANPSRVGSDRFGFWYDDPSPDIPPEFVVSDWVEIYNPGAEPVSLTGLYLSDDCHFPTKWKITADAALTVAPHGFVVIWCPGHFRGSYNCGTPLEPRSCPREIPPHMAPFKLGAGGEWIGLYDKDGVTLIDGFHVPSLPVDQTFGCSPDGDKNNRNFLASPTIGTVSGDRATGAPNTEIINLPPVIKVRSYRGVLKQGEEEIYTLTVDADQEVRVLAHVEDLDDPDPTDDDNNLKPDSVILHWKLIDSPEARLVLMEPESPCPNGCTFEGRIPGQSLGSVIEFWITAEDKQGAVGSAYFNEEGERGFVYPVGARGDFQATVVVNEILADNAGCPDYDNGEIEDPVAPACSVGGSDQGEAGQRNQADDWVELYNFGPDPVPLANLYLTNNELNPLALPLALAGDLDTGSIRNRALLPGKHLLIWCDNDPGQNDSIGIHAPFNLSAREDDLLLVAYEDSDGDGTPELFKILDTVSWGSAEGNRIGPWMGSQDPDWSLGRCPDGEPNWGRMVPTPGSDPKFPGDANGPLVPRVNLYSYEPAAPRRGDPITFFVRAWDEKPLPDGAVELVYEAPFVSPPVPETRVAMEKSPEFGENVYTATIQNDALSDKLQYHVVVTDSDGNKVRFPARDNIFRLLYIGDPPAEHLILSEVVAANRQCACTENLPAGCELGGTDNYGEADDWVEILNPTDGSISLDDYYLTDRLNWINRWRFPRGITLGPGERIVVWCDGDVEQQVENPGPGDALHATFQLNANRDEVALVRGVSERQVVDIFRWNSLVSDISYGRDDTTGEVGMLLEPTPGEANKPLAAHIESIDPSQPALLKPGADVVVSGRALDRTEKVFLVDPVEFEVVDDRTVVHGWKWEEASEISFTLEGEALKLTLPGNLVEGPHLLCVLSGFNETWYDGGAAWTRLEFVSTGGGGGDLFIRSDANDDGKVNIADAIAVLGFLFGGTGDLNCPEAGNANNDDKVNIADAIYILGYIFGGGPEPPAPFPECGTDPDGEVLGPCVSRICR